MDGIHDAPEARARALGGTVRRFAPMRGRAVGSVRVYTASDAVQAPPRRWLLRGLIGEGDLALVHGAPKSGKSFLATRLLYGAALGVGFGAIACPRPLRALYVAAEGEGGFAGRIVALRERFGDAGDAFQYVAQRITVGPPSDHLADLIEAARQMRADVIALDTVARTFGEGDENATRDMGAYVRALDRLREEAAAVGAPWPAVVVVHHAPKAGEGARGSIALPAAADVIVKVERRDGGNIAIVEAAKDAEAGATIRFRLRPGELGEDQDGEPRRTCVAEPDEAADRAGTSRPPLSPQRRRALQYLHDAIARGGEDLPPLPGFPRGVRGCRVEAWRRECDARGLAASDDPDTCERVFRRLRRDLADLSLIAERDG
jgi:hypothetical protein